VEAEVKRPRVDSKKTKTKTVTKTKTKTKTKTVTKTKTRTKTRTKTETETETKTKTKPRDITQDLKVQNGIYAAEKFSDLFSISHVVNLLVRGEYDLHARGSTRGDTLPR
jgi:hypothetical protein